MGVHAHACFASDLTLSSSLPFPLPIFPPYFQLGEEDKAFVLLLPIRDYVGYTQSLVLDLIFSSSWLLFWSLRQAAVNT